MGKLQVMVVSSLRLELRPVHGDKAPALLPLRNLWLPHATSYPFTIYDHVEETAEFVTLVQVFFYFILTLYIALCLSFLSFPLFSPSPLSPAPVSFRLLASV